MLSILPLTLAILLGGGHLTFIRTTDLVESPTRRVRTIDSTVQHALVDGLLHSPTFAQILGRLSLTDVIVYIEPVRDLPDSLSGRMLLLERTDSQRYLRVQVQAGLHGRELVALIGHELRHALEVAEAPDVRDERGLVALYKRIGEASARSSHGYDTVAAQAAGQQVWKEMA